MLIRILCSGLLAWSLALAAPAFAAVTEEFTGADQPGNLTTPLDPPWSNWAGGTHWGIVSNAAKITGAVNTFTDQVRMDVDALLSGLVTVQANVTFTTPDKAQFSQFEMHLQKDGTATDTKYAFVVVAASGRTNATDVNFEIDKVINGAVARIAGPSSLTTISAGDVLKFTWDPATHTLTGYQNGAQKVQVVNAEITANRRAGMMAASNDAGFVAIVDNFSLDPPRCPSVVPLNVGC